MSERTIIRFLLKIGPWMTPVVTMWVVQRSLVNHFALPEPVAWIGASVLEILGIASIYLWMSCNDWNRRHKEGKARSLLAGSLVAMYIGSTITLVIVLDVLPDIQRWALAILPLLSVVAYLSLSIFSELEQMEEDRRLLKEERRTAREVQSSAIAPQVKGNYGEFLQVQSSRNGDGMMTAQEIMREFGVSERTAFYWKDKFQKGVRN